LGDMVERSNPFPKLGTWADQKNRWGGGREKFIQQNMNPLSVGTSGEYSKGPTEGRGGKGKPERGKPPFQKRSTNGKVLPTRTSRKGDERKQRKKGGKGRKKKKLPSQSGVPAVQDANKNEAFLNDGVEKKKSGGFLTEGANPGP